MFMINLFEDILELIKLVLFLVLILMQQCWLLISVIFDNINEVVFGGLS